MSGTVTGPELVPGGLVRPVSLPEVHLSLVFSMLMWLAGLTALGALLLAHDQRVSTAPVATAAAVAGAGLFLAAAARIADARYLARWYGPVYVLLGVMAITSVSLGAYGSRAVTPEVPAFYIAATVLCYFTLRRRVAAGMTVLACLAYLGVLLLPGTPFGVVTALRWLCISLPAVTISTLLGPQAGIAAQATRAAEAARAELTRANELLEERVAEQVTEIERGRALRRFLSPEVAEVVLDDAALLAPHRREVAVLFSDLRGFTAFTAGAEPEDVVRVVGEYYESFGEVLRRHGATIGGYAGDGIMAWIGDPLPVDDPAGVALVMAAEARDVGRVLSARWRARGHDLGVGIGVALGHATLGVVGGVDRRDYIALGSVVNLAARLCAEAADGEVLVDPRAAAAHGVPARGKLPLKGFGEVDVHALA